MSATFYMRLGEVPRKRHIKLPREKNQSFKGEAIHYEHVVTTAGFDRAYSIMYHLRPPTLVKASRLDGRFDCTPAEEMPLRHHHLRSQDMPRTGDPIRGRVPILFNQDLTAYRCKPDREQEVLFRNGAADELIFVFNGRGTFESQYGRLPYRELDYIVVPRGTTYRFRPDDIRREDYLILEARGQYRIPSPYLNPDGQIKMGAPYYERDFHGPTELITIDEQKDTDVLVKDKHRLTRITLANHPFDVVGWDGRIFPFTFNALDFEPLTGTVHLPPPFQTTFTADGFVVCTFAPRHLDHHPEAIKVPYVHSNVDADEVLFYCRGEFGSRKGIEVGSLTLHPTGIPHGPHPGTIMKSMSMSRTEELAVMFDTEHALKLTKQAMQIDDPKYPSSWLDHGPGDEGMSG